MSPKGSPLVLFQIVKAGGDEGKVLAHRVPEIRPGNPAVVCVDGVVLRHLPCNEPEIKTSESYTSACLPLSS